MSRANARASFAADTYPLPRPMPTGATGPWVQIGEVVQTVDPAASVVSGTANTVTPEVSVCLGGSSNTISGPGGGVCLGGFGNTVSGSSASIIGCFECEASGTTSTCLASNGAVASGFCAACIATFGTASGQFSAAIGGSGAANTVASGAGAVALSGGNAAGENSVAIGLSASAPNAGDIALGTATGTQFGVFGASCIPQQPGGGTGTAGAAYTANEQAMLQAVYNALKNFGFIA